MALSSIPGFHARQRILPLQEESYPVGRYRTSQAEIAKIIGVNSLGYLSIEDVVKLADNTENGFCTACFGGGYPTSIPKDGGKDRFECKISEGEKKKNA